MLLWAPPVFIPDTAAAYFWEMLWLWLSRAGEQPRQAGLLPDSVSVYVFRRSSLRTKFLFFTALEILPAPSFVQANSVFAPGELKV